MQKALTVSQARPKLGRLLDQAIKGECVLLRRGNRLLQIEAVVPKRTRIPKRPIGYFKFDDELSALANLCRPL
jgi:hypothetical protein